MGGGRVEFALKSFQKIEIIMSFEEPYTPWRNRKYNPPSGKHYVNYFGQCFDEEEGKEEE